MAKVTTHVWDGDRIRQARKIKDLRAVDAAEKLNITPIHLSYIENGKNNPSAKLIARMAEVYGLPTSFFLKN
ncbi:helix-turn-helix domain-containing protein [Geitlerinema calcuttense]|uniref:Helix-turn-helix transcriptional regulator n=1 Tax=Geitlerinema calcuttense NRMC-F 0142 TaxID=2922238 RepID=A0ABT7LV56_9CYAN|nr:helix-turn-helix transcriptional regulator [Geitlerinema calcuttense]MDL5055916.1 helix-turn-helix transcriptional regulator [Geitlerinema calcuttense NRMC-F 0142]